MKKLLILSVLFFGVGTCMISCTGCSKTETPTAPVYTLSAEEIANLKFLREEEKLARDVYLLAKSKYDLMIFEHISGSEQTHFERIKTLMDKYGIADPALAEEGKFSNATLQDLYYTLAQKTALSELDALIVGATIEDMDINDIDGLLTKTTNPDLVKVYTDLNCGSRNHIRAFNSQIKNQGSTYTPQYISQEKFDSIINSLKEECGK
ncbi:MAG: DUF2202 domain-containing protein [Bacteroidetes bacterium]|nr:MAG: DUF2202 domain-containing protein [Bacteroidota bacterium]